jgi:hypothetical protein
MMNADANPSIAAERRSYLTRSQTGSEVRMTLSTDSSGVVNVMR